MIIKNSAYGENYGLLDPVVLKRTKKKKPFSDRKAEKNINFAKIDFAAIRQGMGSPNQDLTKTRVIVKSILIKCKKRYIPALVCHPAKTKITKNACLYLHGGGFIGGSSTMMLNQCKLIAERADCTMISLDYRLAPEAPFPNALEDTLEALTWTINHQKALGFANSKVFVAGDSAGGNLAVECGLLDKGHRIKQIISIYGALDLQEPAMTSYHWNYANYEMDKHQQDYIHTRINKIMYINNLMRPLYARSQPVTNPLISPVYATDFTNMPVVTLIEAEFDYFLPSNHFFANLLNQNSIKVQEILYKGLDHGFFDRLGYLKQTEQVCDDLANIIKN
ncbi:MULTISPECIES: alpha/beta hydrolase [unclassified Lactobacillus]|uniref:alpha/beta hydrolase n=1 Tax=unclassified Lactobacillus TaxID=2620435 RepID=UPI000EFB6322|nr:MULTISPECIES: alpha/beta hydrolase [unclassified Lactobacillus]RMC38626.1 alpha/beta hydrolase [Lactobacillus sp. ESL0237]RMC42971.1 alpha/beta hydrolase [Lactobacillus sp. ESL0234]RMC43825.1 alpha/beta hydrolase [Lactobacillus sp. ESL0236]RMC48074.1 alpha/beta hydrolase [Lactobacillus sp. ESL0225]